MAADREGDEMTAPTLTDDEVDAAVQAAYDRDAPTGRGAPIFTGQPLWRSIYRAGMAAGYARGVERAIAEIEHIPEMTKPSGCVVIIRALLD